MSAEYYYFKNPNPDKDPEKESLLHPRIVRSQKIHLRYICERISEMSTFNANEAEALMGLMKDEFTKYLVNGDTVCWDGFGTFKITLQSIRTTDPAEMKPSKVKAKSISFRASKKVKQELEYIDLERTRHHRDDILPQEERLKNILRVLKRKGSMQSSQCISINACSRVTGIRDLNILIKKGLIKKLGSNKNVVYILAENKDI